MGGTLVCPYVLYVDMFGMARYSLTRIVPTIGQYRYEPIRRIMLRLMNQIS